MSLFYSVEHYDWLQRQRRLLLEEIDNIDEQELLNISYDDYCNYLIEKYSLDSIEVFKEEIEISSQNSEMVVVALPFKGNSEFFHHRPSQYVSRFPEGVVNGREINISLRRGRMDAEAIRVNIDEQINMIIYYTNKLKQDDDNWDESLPGLVKTRVKQRRDRILSDLKIVESIGIPIRRNKSVDTTYPIVVERKKIIIAPSAKKTTYTPEPELEMACYEDIIDALKNMAYVIERSPSAFINMGEEDLRHHFLLPLNAMYEGLATGETFNYCGKTDILLRYDGRNAFVAECKFWKGPKTITDTITQLLGAQ